MGQLAVAGERVDVEVHAVFRRVRVAMVDQLPDQLEHAVDVVVGVRHVIGAAHAEAVHRGEPCLLVHARQLRLARAAFGDAGDDLVFDVGDVADVVDVEPGPFEVPADHVEDQGGAPMTDVGDVVDRWAADVDRHLSGSRGTSSTVSRSNVSRIRTAMAIEGSSTVPRSQPVSGVCEEGVDTNVRLVRVEDVDFLGAPDFPGVRFLPRGGLVPEVRELAEALCDALAAFEPGRYSGADCVALTELLSRTANSCQVAGARAATKVAECGAYRDPWIYEPGRLAGPRRGSSAHARAPPSAPWPRSRTVPRRATRSSPGRCRWRRRPRSRRCPRTKPSCSRSRCGRVWGRCGRKLAPDGWRRSRPTRCMRAAGKPGSSCTGRTASA